MVTNLKEWAGYRWRWVWMGLWFVVLAFATAAHLIPGPWSWSLGGVDRWHVLLGGLVTLVPGHYLAQMIVVAMREEQDPAGLRRGAVVGLVERSALAAALVAPLTWSVVGPWVGGWVTIKLALNWQTRLKDNGKDARVGAMSALAATVVSLGLAVAGGLLIRASLTS